MRGQVQDQVVRLGGPGEVAPAIVDHPIRADRLHEVQLGGVVNTGDVSTHPLRELNREGSRPSTSAVDQHPATRPGPLRALQGDRTRLRDGRRLNKVSWPGLRASAASGASMYSAKPPFSPRLSPYTSSPVGTGSPFPDIVDQARDVPERSVRRAGNRSPPIRAYAGDPRRHSQSLRLTEVADLHPHLARGR